MIRTDGKRTIAHRPAHRPPERCAHPDEYRLLDGRECEFWTPIVGLNGARVIVGNATDPFATPQARVVLRVALDSMHLSASVLLELTNGQALELIHQIEAASASAGRR